MVTMENSDEILQILERFTRLKQKEIPKELEDYLQYVAKTGDTIFKWSSLKYLFREKLLHVIKHFNEDSPRLEEIPNYPNVDPFNYETMKSSLLERLDLFNSAPFTVQRLCELLIDPRKQYSRIDKFMRALEKNILVVSTVEPGRKRTESENGDSLDSVVNGDLSLEVNIDIEMENETIFNNVDERNGTGNESGSGTLKASCPRSDGAVQPKAKKAKLEYDDDERPETSAGTDDMDDEPDGALEGALKSKPVVHNIEVTIEGDETGSGDAKAAAEKKTVADAQQQTAELEETNDEEAKPAKKSLNGDDKHKDEESAKDETDAVDAVATTKDAEQSEDEEEEPSSEAVKKPEIKAAADKSEGKAASDGKAVAAGEKPEKIENKTVVKEAEQPDTAADKPTAAEPPVEKEQIKTVAADAKAESPSKEGKAAKEKAAEPEGKQLDSVPKAEDDKAKTEEAALDAKSSEPADKDATLETKTDAASDTSADKAAEGAAKTATESAADATKTAKAVATAASDNDNTEKTENEAAAKSSDKTAATIAAENATKDIAATADKIAAAAVAEVPAITAPVPIETDEPAAENVTPPAAAITAAATSPLLAATAAAPPTLALNDQPMEDTPADEETSTSDLAVVEEVVMAESGASAGEMATAMEVDDTSQDMDQ